MNSQTKLVEPNPQWWYQVGGLSGLVLGIGYIVITGVYSLAGALPKGAEPALTALAGQTAAWWLILGLSVLTDLLFIPLAIALYLALKEVNKNAILLGSGLLGLFVFLDLAVTWPNYAALITLSDQYAAAAGDIQRAVFVGPAGYALAVLNSSLFAVYAILIPSVGILIIGLIMLRGPFNKATAYSALGAGLLGIVAVVGPIFLSALGLFAIFSSVLTTVWVLLAGYRLLRLA